MTKKRASSARSKTAKGKVRSEARDLFENIPHPADGKDPSVLDVGELMAQDEAAAAPTSNDDPRKNMAKKTTRKRTVAKIETTVEPPATEEPAKPGGIQDALAKLIRSVDLLRRQERYGQFSLTTLFGVCFQVLSVVLFLILVIMIASSVPLKTIAPIGIVNVLLQLMAMTFLLMNSRR